MKEPLVQIGGAVAGFLVLILGYVVVERQRWLREAQAQCAEAEPLADRRATREEVLSILGSTREYTASDLPELLADDFEATPPKRENLEANLHGGTTLLLYSRSNSIMFLYLDNQHRAKQAYCFLQ